jgi:hypothetical protein
MVIPVGSPEDRKRPHTMAHALGYDECYHERCDIFECVLCGKKLEPMREHLDTCGSRCFTRLLTLQRARDEAYARAAQVKTGGGR